MGDAHEERKQQVTTNPGDGLTSRVLAWAERCPDAVAVVDGADRVSYAQLAQRSARLQQALDETGVRPGTLVGLRLRRGADVLVAILGILRHGCAYLPVDPDYPTARQDYLLRDSGVGRIVEHDPDRALAVNPTAAGGEGRRVPVDTAYVIYTSGSTGEPKGVVVGRRQVSALMRATETVFDFGPDDVWSLFHSHSFDFSVWEIWGALWFGGRVVVIPSDCTWDPAALTAVLDREQVSVLSQVPTSFGYLRRHVDAEPTTLPQLRYVVLGGEPVNLTDVRLWAESGCAPQARLVNMYGITETTVHVTVQDLAAEPPAGPAGTTPIGVPLPHLRVRLLDEGLQPVPAGTPGELVVSGEGVAEGYLGRPELTVQRFVRLPDEDGPAYRSGDWAIADQDGALHFLGRRDGQVQVRGFRIEPGEVAAALSEHPGIAACEVTTPVNPLGETILVAHCLPRGNIVPSPAELRRHATLHLPRHLVPARFVTHTQFPLTAHGKIDRQALDTPRSTT